MKTRTFRSLAVILLGAVAPLLLGSATLRADGFQANELDGYRLFTDSKGNTVTGKILLVEGELVTVQAKTGGSMKARISDLSADDQAFVDRWFTEKVLTNGRGFVFAASPHKEEVQEKKLGATTQTVDEAYYDISLRNVNRLDLKNIRIVNRTYKRDDTGARGEKIEKVYEEETKEVAVWKGGETLEFNSAKQKLEGSKLDGGWRYMDGSRSRRQDRLGGVWVRIYKDGVLIGDFAEPVAVKQNQSWDEGSQDRVADR